MKNILRHALSPFLLASALFALPAHADDLTPAQVADLYLKAMIDIDLASAQKLNDYLREGPNGEDTLSLEMLKNLKSFTIDNMMEGFMSDSGPGTEMPELKPHALEFFTAMNDAIHRARCKAKESTQDGSTTTVRFTCSAPNLDSVKDELKALADDSSSANAIKTFLTRAAAAYRDAPITKTVEGQLPLQATTHGKWSSENPAVVIRPIVEALF